MQALWEFTQFKIQAAADTWTNLNQRSQSQMDTRATWKMRQLADADRVYFHELERTYLRRGQNCHSF